MNIGELVGQVQCKLTDGSVVIITTPTLIPQDNSTIEDIRKILMSLGADQQTAMYNQNINRIIQASNLPNNIKLYPTED